jgi:hypothetical protein
MYYIMVIKHLRTQTDLKKLIHRHMGYNINNKKRQYTREREFQEIS